MNRAGATLPVQSIKVCIVYDFASGKIHHQHRVLTLVGGHEPAENEITADALRATANRRMPPGGNLQTLHVAHDAMESDKTYRVDVRARKLIAG